MNWKRNHQSLHIQLKGDFNLHTVQEITPLLDNTRELHLDLSFCRFVDSEAIIFLHKLIQKQVRIRIQNPPRLFYEVVSVMGLQEEWDLKEIVER